MDRPIRNRRGKRRLVHIGVHASANRNAGDTLLFPVVRRAFDVVLGPFEWELCQAWAPFDEETAAQFNASADGIVLGGGGMLLRDQDGSNTANSGWQWSSTVEGVDAITIPMIIFAIGYNRFRGQPDFDPVFSRHIRHVADRTAFFGLRNNGSIRALSTYLTGVQAARLRRQYCPTTVIWQLYPEYSAMARAHDAGERRVLAVNAAFDRTGMRFGEDPEATLENVALAVAGVQARGWEVVNVAHKTMDRQIEPYLDAASVSYRTVDLTDAGPEEVMAFYAGVDLAFGMRGHAQMIPFGLRRPIFSIISHDKMRFFLEDLDRLSWGTEVQDPELPARLAEAARRIETDKSSVISDIAEVQEKVWDETHANLTQIGREYLGVEKDEAVS